MSIMNKSEERKKRARIEDDEEEDAQHQERNEDKKTTNLIPNSQGEYVFSIGSKRKVTISNYKGSILVNIREFYVDKNSGEEKPGSKGIALSLEQYNSLKSQLSEIDEAISAAKK